MFWIVSSAGSASANDYERFGFKMSVIVLGSINTDLVVRSATLPRPGETVIGGQFLQAAGGKGANQAVAAACAGRSPVTFIAAVGDDVFGQQSLAALRKENLDATYISVLPGHASGIALILVDATGQNAISVASGANLALTPAQVAAVPESVFRGARVFLASLELPLETVEAGLARAKSSGLITILNPAPAVPMSKCGSLLALADIVTPNETEAELLTDLRVSDANSAIAAARWIEQAGPRGVIITLGGLGAVAVQGSDVDVIPARQVTAVDATGAGDAFNGALAVALSEGRSFFEAANWATIAASLATTRAGAQASLPTRKEIESQPS
jgi:ribokinase